MPNGRKHEHQRYANPPAQRFLKVRRNQRPVREEQKRDNDRNISHLQSIIHGGGLPLCSVGLLISLHFYSE
jgi:hypothetical protein